MEGQMMNKLCILPLNLALKTNNLRARRSISIEIDDHGFLVGTDGISPTVQSVFLCPVAPWSEPYGEALLHVSRQPSSLSRYIWARSALIAGP